MNRTQIHAGALFPLAFAALICSFVMVPDSADAKSKIFSFTNTPNSTQAGGHPNVVTAIELGNHFNQSPVPPCECNDPKDITTHTPAGVIATPHVASVCPAADLATLSCSADAQVGLAIIEFLGSYSVFPIFQTVPQTGQAALYAFQFIPGLPQYLSVTGRTGSDYGLDFKIYGISHSAGSPPSIGNVFWGVPGASIHDSMRFAPGEVSIGCVSSPTAQLGADIVPEDCETKSPHTSSLPIAPFVQSPSSCVGPLTSTVETLAYDGETDVAQAPWPATTGCDRLSFAPSLAAAPTTTETDSASGLAVDLRVPQFQDPETPSPSPIRASTVTLPAGFSINPNAADGKVVCTDAQAGFGTEGPSNCPEFSKIGTTTVDTLSLPGPISGYIYLGEPQPNNRYRIVLTAEGFGTNVKIAGSVRPDPATGRIVTAFENLPQAPFREFDLHFFGSERGLLATPEQCGTYPVRSTFKPWAAELSDQTSTQMFVLDSGPGGTPCPNGVRPFSPSLQAGTIDNTGGAHSPFLLRVDRRDGDQNLAGLAVSAPPGFVASLRGVEYCPESAISQLLLSYPGLTEQIFPACPSQSKVGTAVAAAGAGSRPIYVSGNVYLAGPYRGAPLSLVVSIPAVSGPYDLGTVAVRAAIEVDPETAQVFATSDPFPQILQGIPLRTRMIQLNLDRPGFALNPTNCAPFTVDAAIVGNEGTTSNQSADFQVANCADLPYRPKLRIRLTGGIKRRGHPAIHATLSARPGEANSRQITVTLPKGQLLDNSHIGSVCTRADFAKERCPSNSKIGSAEATSPLLDRPLVGSVYLRSSSHDLPDLALKLQGQFEIEAAAHIDSTRGRLRARFDRLPDVPVSKIALDLAGGSKGLLQNTVDLCGPPNKATVKMIGQNGVGFKEKVALRVPCGTGKSHKPNSK